MDRGHGKSQAENGESNMRYAEQSMQVEAWKQCGVRKMEIKEGNIVNSMGCRHCDVS